MPGMPRRTVLLEISHMKVLGPLAATGLLIVVALAAVAAPAPPQGAHTASPTPAIVAPSARPTTIRKSKLEVALPETTLARIFFAKGSADITLRQFYQAAQQLQLSPGALTPQDRDRVLDLLIQKKVLARRAAAEPRAWAHDDSVNYRGLVDRLTLGAALDSALVEQAYALAARGDSVPGKEQLGIMVRDSAMARLKPTYDEAMLQKLADAFEALPKPAPGMSIQEQMRTRTLVPSVSAADSAKALIHSSKGDYTAGQLLSDFGRLNAKYRPAVRTADNVRDVANSVIYENMLRENVAAQDLVHRPSIAAQLAQRAEFLDVQAFVRHAAYDPVPTDSATVRRHYDAHPRWFDGWGRADIVRGVFPSREEADAFAKRLAVPGAADSLVTQTMPGGTGYATYLTEDADTALFARVRRAKVGGIVGPDETVDGWRVFRIMSLVPRQPRPFEAAYDIVLNDWYQRDGDRRVNELMAKLMGSAIVRLNDASVARLVARPAPAATRRSGGRAR
jgi:hypothetical protein